MCTKKNNNEVDPIWVEPRFREIPDKDYYLFKCFFCKLTIEKETIDRPKCPKCNVVMNHA